MMLGGMFTQGDGDILYREAVPAGLKYVGQGEPMLEKATGEKC